MKLLTMSIRTTQQLQAMFQASKERKQKEREMEKLKYKKASESVRKALKDKLSKQHEIMPQKPQKTLQMEFKVIEYRTKYIERYTPDEKLYQTREELEKALPNTINWQKWDEVVEKTRKEIKRILM